MLITCSDSLHEKRGWTFVPGKTMRERSQRSRGPPKAKPAELLLEVLATFEFECRSLAKGYFLCDLGQLVRENNAARFWTQPRPV